MGTGSRVGKREIAFIGVVVMLGSLFAGTDRAPLSSAETRFVERSAGGLQIVPASCPSDPHYAGECSDACSLSASPSTISQGQSSTLSWDTSWDSEGGGWVEIDNGVGRHPASGSEEHISGSASVSPTQTTTYTADRYESLEFLGFPFGSEYIGSCSATVTINPCPSGQVWNGTQCVTPPQCPAGQEWNGSECVEDECPGTICEPPIDHECPAGFVLQGEQCIFVACPAGFILVGNRCVPITGPQCANTTFCVGPNVWRRDAQCVETGPIQYCAFGCANGGCLPAPPGSGNITVTPSLIRSGETTRVTWDTSGMIEDSCIVVENNPEITDSDDGESGTFISSVIRQQTSYTLMCQRQDESQFTDNATVNILPVFQEN